MWGIAGWLLWFCACHNSGNVYFLYQDVLPIVGDRLTRNKKYNTGNLTHTSYYPISLLCSPSIILERLVVNINNPHIPLSPTEHGFRSHHCTSTLLTNLAQNITDGFNHHKPAHRILIATLTQSCTQFHKMTCHLPLRQTSIHTIQRQAFHNKTLHKRSPTRLRTLTHTL